MKSYKKLLMVAPLACTLATGIAAVPHAALAASPTAQVNQQFSNRDAGFSDAQLQKDIGDRMKAAMINRPDLFSMSGHPTQADLNKWKIQFKNATVDYGGYTNSGAINTDVTVDHYTDAGQVELLSYRNETPVNQTFNTPEKSLKSSETFTYSNQEGVKLGVASETKVSASIPFVAEGGETIKVSSEFSYTHTSTNTTTNEETNTFKSQPVVCVPGYTTQFFGTVQNAVFSGSFTGTTIANGDITYSVTTSVGGHDFPVEVNTASNADSNVRGHAVYNIFKYSGQPLPSYVHLDDANKRVLIDGVKSSYNGVGGHYSRVVVKVFPNTRSNEEAITMPYAEYMQ
ncbi:ETX/MTX2 family pore-forming toxin, partial [Bacillus thuringiensis]|uniref:ETX/MTX2 family pore-forming toxin n=1 Tax=Bacillus thuringiensis TaxID=1428 RepID=UPI003D02E750